MVQRLVLIFAFCAVGCFGSSSRHNADGLTDLSSRSKTEASELSLESELSLDRLLKTPADPAHTVSSGDSIQSFPVRSVEDLATDGCRYVLHVDSLNQAAWIEISGGIADHLSETVGPWSLQNPDVQKIVKSHNIVLGPVPDSHASGEAAPQ